MKWCCSGRVGPAPGLFRGEHGPWRDEYGKDFCGAPPERWVLVIGAVPSSAPYPPNRSVQAFCKSHYPHAAVYELMRHGIGVRDMSTEEVLVMEVLDA